jgi:hypothetical protein
MKARPFYLTIDSGDPDEPDTRTFGSLEAAVAAFSEYDPKWQRFAWITEARQHVRDIVHMRDGKIQDVMTAESGT